MKTILSLAVALVATAVGSAAEMDEIAADEIAALASLARIGSDGAFLSILKILEKGPPELRIPAAHAALVCAESLFAQERDEAGHKFLHAIRQADLPAHFQDAAKAISARYPGRI